MFTKLSITGIISFLILSLPGAYGSSPGGEEKFIQRYEKFIPYDYYQGLEDSKYVVIGHIVAVDGNTETVTIRIDSQLHHYKVMRDTPIWLDQAQSKGRNLKGSFSDLKAGLRAEVQTDSEGDKEVAKWIKVQIDK